MWRSFSVPLEPIWCGLSRCTLRRLLRDVGVQHQEFRKLPPSEGPACVNMRPSSLRGRLLMSRPERTSVDANHDACRTKDRSDLPLAGLNNATSERSSGITSLQFTVVVATTPVRCDRCH